ncbi:MAG TPA: hypothetical protein VHS52_09720 [Acidimicrobiales bacterium]|jgi:hypothetical protein|nr:hypothetical protein [Acidimicrobiales bacterium]
MKISSKLAGIAATAALTVGGIAGLASPASAATTGNTITTFAITGGALAITVPASTVALATGTVNTGAASASGQLGTVTVDDTRGALLNGWTTTVSSTTFVTGTASPNETVAVANVKYASGASTVHTGLGVFVPTLTATALGADASYTGAAGNSSTSWDPTLTFTLLSSQVAGTYTGTVTHSVA